MVHFTIMQLLNIGTFIGRRRHIGIESHRPYLDRERNRLYTQVPLQCFKLSRYIELNFLMACPHFQTSLQ